MTPTFRYNPAVVAQAFGTLGALNPGRIVLGIGTGEALNEVAVGAAGSPWPEFKERFARLREAVTLMRRLWTEERVDFEGDYYRTHAATVYDRPEQPIPVYVAAGGPLVARYAGRSGDGFICTSGKGREALRGQGAARRRRGPGQVGAHPRRHRPDDRDQGSPTTATPSRRCTTCASGRRCRSAPSRSTASTTRSRWSASPTSLSDEEIAKRWIVTSDPTEAVDAVRQYVDWGFNHVVFHAPGHDQGRFLEQFSADVLPGLREAQATTPSGVALSVATSRRPIRACRRRLRSSVRPNALPRPVGGIPT